MTRIVRASEDSISGANPLLQAVNAYYLLMLPLMIYLLLQNKSRNRTVGEIDSFSPV